MAASMGGCRGERLVKSLLCLLGRHRVVYHFGEGGWYCIRPECLWVRIDELVEETKDGG